MSRRASAATSRSTRRPSLPNRLADRLRGWQGFVFAILSSLRYELADLGNGRQSHKTVFWSADAVKR